MESDDPSVTGATLEEVQGAAGPSDLIRRASGRR